MQPNPSPRPSAPSADRPQPLPHNQRPPRRSPILRAGALAVAGITVLLVAFVAWQARRFSQIPRVDVAAVDATSDGKVANWLLVGTDSRDGIDPSAPNALAFIGEEVSGTRTDTIMVARADASAGTFHLLSVPRDLWVRNPGSGEIGRINGAFNGPEGPHQLTATVENALGIEINHYVQIDFVGFGDVVDALGGITVDFTFPTRDQQSGLNIEQSGAQTINGDQALALARSRSYEELIDGSWRMDPTGDIGRTQRQRALLAQMVTEAGSSVAPTGLLTLDRTMAAGSRSVVIDDGTGLLDMLEFARTTSGIGVEAIASHTLPVDDRRTSGGAQVLELRERDSEAVLANFR